MKIWSKELSIPQIVALGTPLDLPAGWEVQLSQTFTYGPQELTLICDYYTQSSLTLTRMGTVSYQGRFFMFNPDDSHEETRLYEYRVISSEPIATINIVPNTN